MCFCTGVYSSTHFLHFFIYTHKSKNHPTLGNMKFKQASVFFGPLPQSGRKEIGDMKEITSGEVKNAIAPGKAFWGGFEYTHHNIRQKKVVYYCTYRHGNKCSCALEYSQERETGVVYFENPLVVGEHTCPCAVFNNISVIDTYLWEGKLDANDQGEGGVNNRPVDKISSGIDVNVKDCTTRIIDVKKDMGMHADELALVLKGEL